MTWDFEKAPTDVCTRYVKFELHNHVRGALGLDSGMKADLSASGLIAGWLMDYPFDQLHRGVGQALGQERLEAFANRLEQAGADPVLTYNSWCSTWLAAMILCP